MLRDATKNILNQSHQKAHVPSSADHSYQKAAAPQELEVSDLKQKQRERSNKIFKNIFKEVFLANCGNPIDLEQVLGAFKKNMGGQLSQEHLYQLERLFSQSDLNNDSTLAKDEVRVFISRAVTEGIFTDFFDKQDSKEQAAIDSLFDEIFLDAFLCADDNSTAFGGNCLTKLCYESVVKQKLSDDKQLRDQLIRQFDQVDKGGRCVIDEAQVKKILQGILRQQIKKLGDVDASEDETDNKVKRLEHFTEGAYAKETIAQILLSFRGSTVLGDEETFIQMSELLEIFYGDPDMNRELTKVRGNDFCEILGLFFDLTDSIRSFLLQQVEQKEQLQAALKKIIQEQKSTASVAEGSNSSRSSSSHMLNPCGALSLTNRAKKRQGSRSGSQRAKKLNNFVVEEDVRYLTLLDENQRLELSKHMLKEEFDRILDENEQKDKRIKDLELELKFSAFQKQGLIDERKHVRLQAKNATKPISPETRRVTITIDRTKDGNNRDMSQRSLAVGAKKLAVGPRQASIQAKKQSTIKELKKRVEQLEQEKSKLLAQVTTHKRVVPLETPRNGGASSGNITGSSFSNPESGGLNFTARSKSFANNIINRLKNRVSLPCGSRLSFNMRSQANLSIYRVSEQSDESPEKKSSEHRCKNSVKTESPLTKPRFQISERSQADECLSRRDISRDVSLKPSSRGRVSASFYFHANRLSAWQTHDCISACPATGEQDGPDKKYGSSESMIRLPMTASFLQFGSHEQVVQLRNQLSTKKEHSQSMSQIGTERSHSALPSAEPITTLHDEEAIYPYFSDPEQIRSIKSVEECESYGISSPRDAYNAMKRTNVVKSGANPMPSPGKLLQTSQNRFRSSIPTRGRNQVCQRQLFIEEISARSLLNNSEAAGDVSFESKGIEQDYDQICLKVHLHPLHHVAKSLLSDYFAKNGGGSNQSLSKVLQSKSTLAINVTLWTEKRRNPAVLVIAAGIVLLAGKDTKRKLLEPLRLRSVQSVIVSHNQAGMIALHLSDAVQVLQGYSHLIFETASLGLFLRYILNSQPGIKLDFSDSINLAENGSIEELYFSQLVDYFHHLAEIRDLSNSKTDSNMLRTDQNRISHALLSMNNRGLISSRSDVIALLSGELLELRTETSLLFKTSYHWEPHYYLLTSIGILKFERADMTRAPSFVPLKNMISADLVDHRVNSTNKILLIPYVRDPLAGQETRQELRLSSETPSQIIEWSEMVQRLRNLYAGSKNTIDAVIGKRSRNINPFDNSPNDYQLTNGKTLAISPIDTVRKVVKSPRWRQPLATTAAAGTNKRLLFRQ